MASESGPGTIEVTPIKAEDFEMAARWLSDPEINRWLTSEWRGQEVTSRMIAMVVRNKRTRVWIVHLDGTPCALIGLFDIDFADRTAVVWTLVGDRTLYGRGVGTRAMGELVRLGFDELGLVNLHGWLIEDNIPSRRMLEKNGFREAGRVRKAVNFGGRQVDRVYFDLVNE
ncbi:MAG: GNAT family N-acetyltransferase [Planctomycetota bacterium]|jgi:RimJ/RimL family protein N-acetyltransferase